MTTFTTCTGCKAKGDCERTNAIKAAVKGLFVTSIKHVCKSRIPAFEPGNVVLVSFVEYHDREGYDVKYRGIFIKQKGSTGLCFIRPGTKSDCDSFEFLPFSERGKGFLKVSLRRIMRIDGEPRISIEECQRCGEIPSLSCEETSGCNGNDPCVPPCLRRQKQKAEECGLHCEVA